VDGFSRGTVRQIIILLSFRLMPVHWKSVKLYLHQSWVRGTYRGEGVTCGA
jgi:hypothetical protein